MVVDVDVHSWRVFRGCARVPHAPCIHCVCFRWCARVVQAVVLVQVPTDFVTEDMQQEHDIHKARCASAWVLALVVRRRFA